jgi:6-phosphogluconate dehydrogenase (decarboxylating) (EC 1.1.1.44)
MKANIGLIGLAVMGQNLALNMNDHGFKVAVYNRTTRVVDEFLTGPAKNTQIIGTHSLEELIDNLESPRIVMLMVKAGEVVDQYIDKLTPLLSADDIIVDGGNSLFTDTQRRTSPCNNKTSFT